MSTQDDDYFGGTLIADLGEGWTLVTARLFDRERGDLFRLSHDASDHQRFTSNAFSLKVLVRLGNAAQRAELADRFANQERTRQGAIEEVMEAMEEES